MYVQDLKGDAVEKEDAVKSFNYKNLELYLNQKCFMIFTEREE